MLRIFVRCFKTWYEIPILKFTESLIIFYGNKSIHNITISNHKRTLI